MADQLTPADVEPEHRHDSTAAFRVAMQHMPHQSDVDAPAVAAFVHAQRELERLKHSYQDPSAYVSRLETAFARRSQELLEADEREAALVRRFREQMLRIAELERRVREQKSQIEELRAVLPPRPRGLDSELLRIRGIGPKYARALEALGLGTISAIAALSSADVQRIEQQLRIRNGRIHREHWVEQAQALQRDTRVSTPA